MCFNVEVSFSFEKGIPILIIDKTDDRNQTNEIILKGWKEINNTLDKWFTHDNIVQNIQSWENAYRKIVKILLENGWERECYIEPSTLIMPSTQKEYSGLQIHPPYIPCIDWSEYNIREVIEAVILKDGKESEGYNFEELDNYVNPLKIYIDKKDEKRLDLKAGEMVKVIFYIGSLYTVRLGYYGKSGLMKLHKNL